MKSDNWSSFSPIVPNYIGFIRVRDNEIRLSSTKTHIMLGTITIPAAKITIINSVDKEYSMTIKE